MDIWYAPVFIENIVNYWYDDIFPFINYGSYIPEDRSMLEINRVSAGGGRGP